MDPEAASIRILMAVDGRGSSVNSGGDLSHPAYVRFVAAVSERTLGLPPGTLRAVAGG